MNQSLLEPRSGEENEMAKKIRSEIIDIWLGGTDRAVEGNWTWLSDGSEIRRDLFWAEGKPTTSEEENCLSQGWLGFLDRPCSRLFGFVCINP